MTLCHKCLHSDVEDCLSWGTEHYIVSRPPLKYSYIQISSLKNSGPLAATRIFSTDIQENTFSSMVFAWQAGFHAFVTQLWIMKKDVKLLCHARLALKVGKNIHI